MAPLWNGLQRSRRPTWPKFGRFLQQLYALWRGTIAQCTHAAHQQANEPYGYWSTNLSLAKTGDMVLCRLHSVVVEKSFFPCESKLVSTALTLYHLAVQALCLLKQGPSLLPIRSWFPNKREYDEGWLTWADGSAKSYIQQESKYECFKIPWSGWCHTSAGRSIDRNCSLSNVNENYVTFVKECRTPNCKSTQVQR